MRVNNFTWVFLVLLCGALLSGASDHDDTFTVITLRHPKEAAGKIQYTINQIVVDFYPYIPDAAKTIAIASSAYGENHEEKTISCFGSTMYEEDPETHINHSLVLYRRFRGNTDAYGVVDHYQTLEGGRPHINRIAMTAGSGATNGSMAEPIYLGVVVTHGKWAENLSKLEINVYRYEPNPEDWIKIGNKTIGWSDDLRHIDDVALAADGNDLWVFWLYSYLDENEDRIRDFRGYRINNASGRNTIDTISNNSFYAPNVILGDVINADWDNIIDLPRIIWTRIDGGYYKTYAGRVVLHPVTKQPNEMDHIHQISNNNSSHASNPSIAVNNSEYDEFRAFAGFTFGENTSNVKLKLINGDDVWQQPENYYKYGIDPLDSYITYRYFGTSKFIWMESETIQSKDEIIAEGNHYHKCLQLKTNRNNKKDIYTSYSEDQTVIIQELHP